MSTNSFLVSMENGNVLNLFHTKKKTFPQRLWFLKMLYKSKEYTLIFSTLKKKNLRNQVKTKKIYTHYYFAPPPTFSTLKTSSTLKKTHNLSRPSESKKIIYTYYFVVPPPPPHTHTPACGNFQFLFLY